MNYSLLYCDLSEGFVVSLMHHKTSCCSCRGDEIPAMKISAASFPVFPPEIEFKSNLTRSVL